jgi:uncharacterized protein (DUF433 family)
LESEIAFILRGLSFLLNHCEKQVKILKMGNLLNRITIVDGVCNGKPTIRGMRITAQTILEFILAGDTDEDILKAFPVLEQEDLQAVKQFALRVMSNDFSIREIKIAA